MSVVMDTSSRRPWRGRARQAGFSRAVRMLVVPVAAVAVWYALSRLVFVVPAPLDTLRALVKQLGDGRYRADVVTTLSKIAIAFVAAAVLGVLTGSLLGLSRPLREALEPLVLITNGLPKIVLYPILLITFGLGSTSQIALGIIFGMLPILVNLMSALASMRPVYRKVARMLEVGPVRAFCRVYLPAVAHMLMVALQLGFSLSVLGVVYGELIASSDGLGQRVIQTYSVGDYATMAASIVVIVCISLGGTGLLSLVHRCLARGA